MACSRLPLPKTVRELEAQGLFEGDTGHTTDPRPDVRPYRRRDAGGQDGEHEGALDAEERIATKNCKFVNKLLQVVPRPI